MTSLGSLQIRGAHRRQTHTVKFFRWKCDWNSQNGAEYFMLPKERPDRDASSEKFDDRPSNRKTKQSQIDAATGDRNPGGRKLRQIRFGISYEKIEYPMFAGVHPGGKS